MRRRIGAPVAIGALLLAALSLPSHAIAASQQVITLCNRNVAPGHFACFAERLSGPAPATGDRYQAAAAPSGYGPADLASAYGLGAAPSGSGRRVFVIAAFDDPTAASDLAAYRSAYGLPACTVASGCFRKVNQAGATAPLPLPDSGWAGEISLDLDMVSATCPACSITLVEATDDTDNLLVATKEAATLGAAYVSMSWGGSDDSADTAHDAQYLKASGVAYTAATGDSGYSGGASYPATSPYVMAVGGTSLTRTSTARGWDETAWSGAGSGCTGREPKPAWQGSVSTSCGGRAIADVSAVADPATGVAVYDTYQSSGWGVFGGTSASAPIIAAIAARSGANGNPDSYAYAHRGSFNDATSGSTSGLCLGSVLCQAGVGWDGPTGLGTPRGVTALAAPGATPSSCLGNLIGNGGFEFGRRGWSVLAALVHRNRALAHTGSHYVLLDGTGHTRTDRLARTLTIPRGCRATLTYYLRVSSADRTRTAHDILTLRVNGTVVQHRSNLNRSARYRVLTLDLTRYAGQRITLAWVGHENARLATGFFLDDISLRLSR